MQKNLAARACATVPACAWIGVGGTTSGTTHDGMANEFGGSEYIEMIEAEDLTSTRAAPVGAPGRSGLSVRDFT